MSHSTRVRVAAVSLSLVVLIAVRGVGAQNPSVLTLLDPGTRHIAVGETSAGSLGSGDWSSARGALLQAWGLRLEAGSRVSIDLESDAFDAYLYLVGPGIEAPLSDDDGAGGCNSRIGFTSATGGEYRIIVSSLGSGESGEFTLTAGSMAGPVSDRDCGDFGGLSSVSAETLSALVPQGQIGVGETRSGVLDDAHQVGSRYLQGWDLTAVAGESVTIDLLSGEFDTYLFVTGPGLDVDTDDDSGGSCNARITLVPREAGPYRIGVSSFGSSLGSYELRIAAVAPPESTGPCPGTSSGSGDATELLALPTDGRRLELGGVVNGTLTEGVDPEFDGAPAQAWTLEVAAGTAFTVDLISDDFDAMLHLAGPGMDGSRSNDDGGGACHSRLTHTAAQSGIFHVVATSLLSESGDYTLRVSSQPGPTDPDACNAFDVGNDVGDALEGLDPAGRSVEVGEPMTGQLTDADEIDGRALQAWALVAEAGDSFTVDLESDSFDAYLYITGPGISTALTDDDGGEGFNSRLVLQATAGGTYHVVVSALGSATGAFVLRVVRN